MTSDRAREVDMNSKKIAWTNVAMLFAILALPLSLTAQNNRYKLIDLKTFGGPNGVVNGVWGPRPKQ